LSSQPVNAAEKASPRPTPNRRCTRPSPPRASCSSVALMRSTRSSTTTCPGTRSYGGRVRRGSAAWPPATTGRPSSWRTRLSTGWPTAP